MMITQTRKKDHESVSTQKVDNAHDIHNESTQDSNEATTEFSGHGIASSSDEGEKPLITMMWRRFIANGLARVGLLVLTLFIVLGVFAEFIAPYSGQANSRNQRYLAGPPQGIHFCEEDKSECGLRPFVYAQRSRYNVLSKSYEVARIKKGGDVVRYPVSFFVEGEPYHLWGIIPSNIHLFGVPKGGHIHIMGTDRSGFDLFSRLVYATRTSLGIGFMGVMLAFVLSLIIGGIAGYFGGAVDTAIQSFTDVVRVIPEIPLFMALSASFPLDWSSQQVFFAMTIVLGLIGWPTLARRLRTHLLTIRNENYIHAARISGAGTVWILRRHLIPSFFSYIVVELVINFPYMILKETSLTIIGLGLTRPTMSWGVLLQEMMSIEAILLTPWYVIPLFFFVFAVLAFVLVGDGLRDAADPYQKKS